MNKIRVVLGRRWWSVAVAAGLLATVGVPAAAQSAQARQDQAPTWTQRSPATSPPVLAEGTMAYDAATGNVVLFGGQNNQGQQRSSTWVWNGTTWTQQHPANNPPARLYGAMTYDAATGDVVLFGGLSKARHNLKDTWLWNGTTWTRAHPATVPPARWGAEFAYDTATGTAVMFDGHSAKYLLNGTWVWTGTNWAEQSATGGPSPRWGAPISYDAATGNVVMFGGFNTATGQQDYNETWTWDGTSWTQQAPAASPSARSQGMMTYDAATGNVVLYGGFTIQGQYLGDTWTWG